MQSITASKNALAYKWHGRPAHVATALCRREAVAIGVAWLAIGVVAIGVVFVHYTFDSFMKSKHQVVCMHKAPPNGLNRMLPMLPDMQPISKPASPPASSLTTPCQMFLTRRHEDHEGNASFAPVVALCDILFIPVKTRVNSMGGVSNV